MPGLGNHCSVIQSQDVLNFKVGKFLICLVTPRYTIVDRRPMSNNPQVIKVEKEDSHSDIIQENENQWRA